MTPPSDWLYTSKRLDLIILPADPFFGPVLVLGDATYYRCTPAVLRWLHAAGAVLDARLQRQLAAGEVGGPECDLQCEAYVRGMEAVRAFVEVTYGLGAIQAELARPGTPTLPDVGRVPD